MKRLLAGPLRLWWSSLPLRIVGSTLVGSVLVLLLGGAFLMRQASDGIQQGKRETAVAEASVALERMQQQLRDADLQTASLYDRFGQLADEVGAQPNQYYLVIQGPVSGFVAPGIRSESVPTSIMTTLSQQAQGMYVTPTEVLYTDPDRGSVPGLVVGGLLLSPNGVDSYPVYFIFPMEREQATVELLQRAVLTTGGLLLLLLTVISLLVSRQVVRPIRQASVTAGRLAEGHLDERMGVRGSDDLASLAKSMNHMATELQSQIVQLEDLSKVQQQFVADVSHELRTPLTTVRMAADLIYEGRAELDPSLHRATELLRNELDRFEDLLGDLLEISRFDAGAAVLTLDETDLVSLVRDEVTAQTSFATSAGSSLHVIAVAPATAEVDARRIRRILRNLITNAIEHGEGRPIEVTVAADDHAVAITVRDHGVGLQASHVRDVFHRFWRADPSRARRVGGTGLGLSIAMEDAHLHHGWLAAWGRPGRGAQFRLTLPRQGGVVLRSSPLALAPPDYTTPLALPPGPTHRDPAPGNDRAADDRAVDDRAVEEAR
ncbi:HAMP domain-containing histidine kinase [Tessaracoccus sp. SD287]|uniref:MtrAB system histidine kinase MtrB n=1 Tax=Tessaracoccus sp. SD287 TaxID=2782008 RepID=UPI001A963017|nr:MtrAB system histidine kinase MtrB [Tessaracoccus sp. SD287]MBO1030910.1 HAMP domain-containing histidine kinase [Tessaracoccus sp. SD287]